MYGLGFLRTKMSKIPAGHSLPSASWLWIRLRRGKVRCDAIVQHHILDGTIQQVADFVGVVELLSGEYLRRNCLLNEQTAAITQPGRKPHRAPDPFDTVFFERRKVGTIAARCCSQLPGPLWSRSWRRRRR